jgi:hypothetical protein
MVTGAILKILKTSAMKTYKGHITTLEPHQILVFGSNTQGRHGKGVALFARQYFGAINGRAIGIQGQSYAIITKDLTKSKHPSIEEVSIIGQISELYEFARLSPDKEFFIAYAGTGNNLNGYTPQQMAKMFGCMRIPENIVFEEEFAKLL